jgi:hypothetical protein
MAEGYLLKGLRYGAGGIDWSNCACAWGEALGGWLDAEDVGDRLFTGGSRLRELLPLGEGVVRGPCKDWMDGDGVQRDMSPGQPEAWRDMRGASQLISGQRQDSPNQLRKDVIGARHSTVWLWAQTSEAAKNDRDGRL